MTDEKTEKAGKPKADDKEKSTPTPPASTTEPATSEAKGESTDEEPKGRLIKYMGSADIKIIPRGETVGGTLPEMPYPIRFKASNNWTLDTSKFPEVDAVWWDHLTQHDNFKDVTDYKVKPLNDHQTTFLGMAGSPVYNEDLDALAATGTTAPPAS